MMVDGPERRGSDHGKPTIVVDYERGMVWIQEMQYTGATVIHWKDGKPLRLEFPNPDGWGGQH